MPLRTQATTGQPYLTSRLANLPTVGEYVPEREWCGQTAVSFSSTILNLTYFTATVSETVTTITAATMGAAAATPTFCGMAVYSVAVNGDLTQVAVTANDTALFAAANTSYAKAFSSSFQKVAGQRYAVGVLVVTAGTMPTFIGQMWPASNPMVAQTLAAPTIAARVAGANDLAGTSIAVGSLIGAQGRVQFKLS